MSHSKLAASYLSFLALQVIAGPAIYLWLRPSSGSLLNVVVGTVGVLCMIGMLVYSVARRSATLRRWMRLSLWLHLHIYLGLQGIFLAYLHCMPMLWRHGLPMLLNPGMLNLYALTTVFASGLFGRYLYAQVPKTLGGQHLSTKEVDAELASLDQPVPAAVQALWADPPRGGGVGGVLRAASARRTALADLDAMDLDAELKALASRRIVLVHQRAVVQTARRIFGAWIVLHRPIALAMYLITFVHVVLGVLYAPSLELL